SPDVPRQYRTEFLQQSRDILTITELAPDLIQIDNLFPAYYNVRVRAEPSAYGVASRILINPGEVQEMDLRFRRSPGIIVMAETDLGEPVSNFPVELRALGTDNWAGASFVKRANSYYRENPALLQANATDAE